MDQSKSNSKFAKQNCFYKMERVERKLYHSDDFHVTFLQLIFSLMLTPWCGILIFLFHFSSFILILFLSFFLHVFICSDGVVDHWSLYTTINFPLTRKNSTFLSYLTIVSLSMALH